MIKVAVFGSTGSIGTQSLDVIAHNPEQFSLFALVAQSNIDGLLEQCLALKPQIAAIADQDQASQLEYKLKAASSSTQVIAGNDAIATLAASSEYDVMIAGITGSAGLPSTWEAVSAGKTVLLANKESMVMAGQFLTEKARQTQATIIPVDSEHNAIHQCLQATPADSVHSIVLTASGGPFLNRPADTLHDVTPAQACAHPKWSMGKKISVDSATLMNKGLEVIEAYWLFGLAPERIEVVIHPQSLIHGMVKLRNGSVLSQMAGADMRIPIASALGYTLNPHSHIESGAGELDFSQHAHLEFAPVDDQQFPCLGLAYAALEAGKASSIALNVANEGAVGAFLENRIKFTDIYRINSEVLAQYADLSPHNIDDVFAIANEIQLSDSMKGLTGL